MIIDSMAECEGNEGHLRLISILWDFFLDFLPEILKNELKLMKILKFGFSVLQSFYPILRATKYRFKETLRTES